MVPAPDGSAGLSLTRTPGSVGQVLTMVDPTTAEFQTLPSAAGAVLLSPGGDQTITAGALILNVGPLTAPTVTGTTLLESGILGSQTGELNLYHSDNSAFIIACGALGGNAVTLVPDPFAQSTDITIPDPGTATAKVVLNRGTTLMGSDAFIDMDYDAGTEAANAVTVNTQTGKITTSSLTVVAGSSYTFTLTNNKILGTNEIVMVQWIGGSNTNPSMTFSANVTGVGTVDITIYNTATLTSISGTVILGFVVL